MTWYLATHHILTYVGGTQCDSSTSSDQTMAMEEASSANNFISELMENYDRKAKALGLLAIEKGSNFSKQKPEILTVVTQLYSLPFVASLPTPSPKHIKSNLVLKYTWF